MPEPADTEDDSTPTESGRQTKTTGLHQAIGRAIKSFRAERNWRQIDLAERTGGSLTRATIANIEAGNRRVDLDELFPLCQALGVTLAELIDRGGAGFITYGPRDDEPNLVVKTDGLVRALVGAGSAKAASYEELLANAEEKARQVAREESRAVARETTTDRFREVITAMLEAVTDGSKARPW